MSSPILKNYKRVEEVLIGTNTFKNIKYLITFDGIPPILFGKGEERPSIWLSMRSPVSLSWFYVVADNKSIINEISIDLTQPKKTIIKSKDIILVEAEKITDSKIRINKFDLRPTGFVCFLDGNQLTVGQTNAVDSHFEDSPELFIFRSDLKEVYDYILTRFPAGREAAYLLNNKNPDIDSVIQNLFYIAEGKDSDRRYTDESSKHDAKNFIRILEDIKEDQYQYYTMHISKEQKELKIEVLHSFEQLERTHRTERGEIKEISLHCQFDIMDDREQFYGEDIDIYLKVDEVTPNVLEFVARYNFLGSLRKPKSFKHILGFDKRTIKALEWSAKL